MKDMIEITGIDLAEFVKKVYELSSPAGLGFLHFTPEPLTIEEAKHIVEHSVDPYGFDKQTNELVLFMDYVKGRSCKMIVWQKGQKLFIKKNWHDHTDYQLKQLLKHFNITITTEKQEHGISCHCMSCQLVEKLKKQIAGGN